MFAISVDHRETDTHTAQPSFSGGFALGNQPAKFFLMTRHLVEESLENLDGYVPS